MYYSEDPLDASTLMASDPLRHIVALKAIANNASCVRVKLLYDPDGWGLLTILPARVSQWNRENYPDSERIVLVDGTNTEHLLTLLDRIPLAMAVIKTDDTDVMAVLLKRGAIRTTSFISFTNTTRERAATKSDSVEMSYHLTPEAHNRLTQTGYSRGELSKHFENGAAWFGLRRTCHLAALCFVYQNYKDIWEIGGVCTARQYRRQGCAKRCVEAAIGHLTENNRIVRYQACENNKASLELAQAAGLEEFLRLHHYWLQA